METRGTVWRGDGSSALTCSMWKQCQMILKRCKIPWNILIFKYWQLIKMKKQTNKQTEHSLGQRKWTSCYCWLQHASLVLGDIWLFRNGFGISFSRKLFNWRMTQRSSWLALVSRSDASKTFSFLKATNFPAFFTSDELPTVFLWKFGESRIDDLVVCFRSTASWINQPSFPLTDQSLGEADCSRIHIKLWFIYIEVMKVVLFFSPFKWELTQERLGEL